MRKIIITIISSVLCLGFTVTANAEEGGLVPTVKVGDDGTSYSEEYIEEHAEEYTGEDGTFISEDSTFISGYKIVGANETVPAVREDGEPIAKYLNMGELYNSWFRNEEYKYGYPDYVCGVWTETGDMSELVVAVTKDEKGNAGKEEILSLIEDDNSVKFVYQIYSYTELRDIQEELSPLMSDNGVYGLGVDEMNNKVSMVVNMEHPNIQEFMKKCFEQYGDKVCFEAGSEIVLQSADVVETDADIGAVTFANENSLTSSVDFGSVVTKEETLMPPVEEGAIVTIGAVENKADNPWIFAVCVVVVVFLAGIVFALSKNKAKQTTAGTIVGGDTALSFKETERLVAESEETPSDSVFETVMKEIE